MRTARAASVALLVLTAACSRLTDRSGAGPGIPPVRIAVTSGRAEHVVSLGGTPRVASGPTVGVAVSVSPAGWLDLYGRSAGGRLIAPAAPRDNHDLAEAEVGTSVLVLPWLAVVASVEGRRYAGALASQRWLVLRTGAEARMDLVNGGIRGVIRGSFLPKVTVDGLASPTLALGGATGVELRRKRLFGALLYAIDRFDFPAGVSEKRSEQLSSLMLQAGWRFGR